MRHILYDWIDLHSGNTMINDKIKVLRTDAGLSQSELAKKLSITRAIVIELDSKKVINISKYNKTEAKLISDLMAYIDIKNRLLLSKIL